MDFLDTILCKAPLPNFTQFYPVGALTTQVDKELAELRGPSHGCVNMPIDRTHFQNTGNILALQHI
jgi:hypothetical protein